MSKKFEPVSLSSYSKSRTNMDIWHYATLQILLDRPSLTYQWWPYMSSPKEKKKGTKWRDQKAFYNMWNFVIFFHILPCWKKEVKSSFFFVHSTLTIRAMTCYRLTLISRTCYKVWGSRGWMWMWSNSNYCNRDVKIIEFETRVI